MKKRLLKLIKERIHNKRLQIYNLKEDKQFIRAYFSRWNGEECLPTIQRFNKQIKTLQKDIERLEKIAERLQ